MASLSREKASELRNQVAAIVAASGLAGQVAIKMMWLRVLRRRSQMDRTRLDKLGRYAAASWPPLKILHPWPDKRFSRHIPEAGAPCVSAHAGICTGGAGQLAFLP